MKKRGNSFALSLAGFVAVTFFALAPAHAQWELWESDETYGELSANLQMLSAYIDLRGLEDAAEPLGIPQEAGLGGAVGRLEWSAELGDMVSIDLHNRFVWQSSTLPDELLVQGFGVSQGDDRTVSTEYDFIDGETTRLTHDIDRLVVGLYFDLFDVYLGRQAIRWGVSDLFGVADRFAPLSPFELDTLQRRGIDAARVVTAFSPDLELDIVVADRGDGEPLSLATRLEYFGTNFDAYGGVGRFWQRLSAMGGLSILAGYWKVFAEGEMLWNLDEEELDRPRATVGAQRVAMDWQISAEYHYNGFGAAPGEDYGPVLEQPEVARGETYFVGRHYGGFNGVYTFESGWSAGGGAMMNVIDPSVVVFPTVRYEFEQQFSVSAGAYMGFGEGAELDMELGGLSLPSEFGGVPDLYYLQMTAFF